MTRTATDYRASAKLRAMLIRHTPIVLVLALALVTSASCSKKDSAGDKTSSGATKSENKQEQLEPAATAVAAESPIAAIYDIPIKTLSGEPGKIGDHSGKALLVVNVASQCGLTPQYATLETLQKKYAARGFTVLGFPCNQFGGQEPGTHEEIATFCTKNYGVTFPMFEKIEVNGENRHPIYDGLTAVKDAEGKAGDIQWNFEKFVISADGKTVTRFRPKTVPDAPEVIAAIEAGLPSS